MTEREVPTNGSRGPSEEPHEVTEPTPDYTVAVSPRQLAAGFAIVAALLVLLVRRRRRGSKG